MPHSAPGFIAPTIARGLSTCAASQLPDSSKTSANKRKKKCATPASATTKSAAAPQRRAPLTAPALSTQPATQRTDCAPRHDPRIGAKSGASVLLFRSDLRLDDHAALHAALHSSACVVALYCFDPRDFGRNAFGGDKTGRNQARFLLESVRDLRARLRARGGDLVVRCGTPEHVVARVARAVSARRVFVHRDAAQEGREVEQALRSVLGASDVELRVVWGNSLFDEEDLPFRPAHAPDTYTEFREAVRNGARVRDPLQAPREMPALPRGVVAPGDIPGLRELGLCDDGDGGGGASRTGLIATGGGEREALGRMALFVRRQCAGNDIDGERSVRADFAHRVAPWLALGCVSPRRIVHELRNGMRDCAIVSCDAYHELVWREFTRCVNETCAARRAGASTRGASHRSSAAVQ